MSKKIMIAVLLLWLVVRWRIEANAQTDCEAASSRLDRMTVYSPAYAETYATVELCWDVALKWAKEAAECDANGEISCVVEKLENILPDFIYQAAFLNLLSFQAKPMTAAKILSLPNTSMAFPCFSMVSSYPGIKASVI